MIIKRGKRQRFGLDQPLKHADHKRPVTRRDFLSQGFIAGMGTVVAPTLLGSLAFPRWGRAALPGTLLDYCNITEGAGKIPFICFDLAGGANISGSNVLVGQQSGQLDFLTTQGYSKQGLPGNMVPNTSVTGTFIDQSLGLAFHSDSAFLRGILEKFTTNVANTNGAVIPARSENDTGNNPHNPMYGIARAGSNGSLLRLIGSQNSDSGGNSMAPAMLINPEWRPTKIDSTRDATGLVDTGALKELFSDPSDTVRVMESIYRISESKINPGATTLTPTFATGTDPERDAALKKLMQCGYVKTADTIEKFSDPGALNPEQPLLDGSPPIAGPGGIFTAQEFADEREFQKTAAVMKLVIEGYAGAGTISMGGYDYHTGNRSDGEGRDLRAGRCMGACLEYAARRGKPLMMYVFSDGSLSSNGRIDDSVGGRGKGEWTGDNQQVAASFFLVYNPGGKPVLIDDGVIPVGRRQQLGYFRRDGDVETAGSPGANNVNALVQMVLLNYMALHGEQSLFNSAFTGHGLGSEQSQAGLIAFQGIVNGRIGV